MRGNVEPADCVEVQRGFTCLMRTLNQKPADQLRLVRSFLMQHIFYCKIITRPELQVLCRTLHFAADYQKPGLCCWVPRCRSLAGSQYTCHKGSLIFLEPLWSSFRILQKYIYHCWGKHLIFTQKNEMQKCSGTSIVPRAGGCLFSDCPFDNLPRWFLFFWGWGV